MNIMTTVSAGSFRRCTRCVMDTSAADIVFDKDGVCNYCSDYLSRASAILQESDSDKAQRLDAFVKRVKSSGRRKKYDCIIGVSGGVDSSWALVQAKRLGLRPLAVHMDNGWNSELAQNNIANLVRTLDVDLYTHVIDWTEYRRLMQAFFDADVIDVELLYDNAMLAVNFAQASKYGLRYILAGTNTATEGLKIPADWNWFKYDQANIESISRAFAVRDLRTFPSIGTFGFIRKTFFRGIRWTPFLDYLPYNKFDALNCLEESFGYKRYAYKHYESIFTRFYQGFLLPNKFRVDKRKVHFSNLIASGQMLREDAIADLSGIPYPSESDLQADISYFLKKMKWTPEMLSAYLARPPVPHSRYKTEYPLWKRLRSFYDVLQKR